MKRSILSDLNPGEQLVFLILAFLIAGLLFFGLAIVLASFIFSLPMGEVMNIMSTQNEEDGAILKLIQIISGAGNYIFAALLVSLFFTGSWTAWFHGERRVSLPALLLAMVVLIISIPFVNLITEFNLGLHLPWPALQAAIEQMETQAESLTWILTGTESLRGLAVNILMIALIPGIGEELIFRGLLQSILTRAFRNGHWAILLTAVVFSALHLQFLSFLPRLFLGILLGYLYYYGKSIWYPILAHTCNNLIGVLYYFFAHQENASDVLESLGTSSLFGWSALISLLLLLAVFFCWYRMVSQLPLSGLHQKG